MQIRPKKSLGQHFLRSPKALADIISAAQLQSGEDVLEIGPGEGVLTEALLGSGVSVTAVEKDRESLAILEHNFADRIAGGQLKLVEGDILKYEPKSLLPNASKYAIVANIPYYITGAILEKFLSDEFHPEKMILLVQKEVAERIMARDKKESLLSLSVKAFGEPRIVSRVPRGAFVPPPNVDSAILTIENISRRKFIGESEQKSFFRVLHAGFSHKRKFLARNLESVAEPSVIADTFHGLGIDPKSRAEDLNIDQWLKISQKLAIKQN